MIVASSVSSRGLRASSENSCTPAGRLLDELVEGEKGLVGVFGRGERVEQGRRQLGEALARHRRARRGVAAEMPAADRRGHHRSARRSPCCRERLDRLGIVVVAGEDEVAAGRGRAAARSRTAAHNGPARMSRRLSSASAKASRLGEAHHAGDGCDAVTRPRAACASARRRPSACGARRRAERDRPRVRSSRACGSIQPLVRRAASSIGSVVAAAELAVAAAGDELLRLRRRTRSRECRRGRA